MCGRGVRRWAEFIVRLKGRGKQHTYINQKPKGKRQPPCGTAWQWESLRPVTGGGWRLRKRVISRSTLGCCCYIVSVAQHGFPTTKHVLRPLHIASAGHGGSWTSDSYHFQDCMWASGSVAQGYIITTTLPWSEMHGRQSAWYSILQLTAETKVNELKTTNPCFKFLCWVWYDYFLFKCTFL